jgi:O-antigen/teichoic acid export membrane protein
MSLRTQVLRGGTYLVLRQGLGAIISAVGILLLTRAIGPDAYGIWAAALGIYTYLFILSRWGIEVYLIRHEEEPQPQDYNQAFSLLLLSGLVGAGLAVLALPMLERWVRLDGFSSVAVTVLVGLPVSLVSLVPLARLERALDYRKVAAIELSGQTTTYLVAVPLAYGGLGPWAPVSGWWAQQLLTLALLYRASAYRPRLHWEPARVRAMLGYGSGYSASQSLWQLRTLVNPLVVGRYAGAEAVGYVALTIRLVEQLSSLTTIASRISLPVLARLQRDPVRLMKAVTEGTSLQIMVLGPILVGFSWASPWIIPPLFGPRWLPVTEVFPFIALSYLSMTMLHMCSSALYVLRKNVQVAVFHLLHVAMFAGAALLLVPSLGIRGYGWAEVAALPSYLLSLTFVTLYIGKPSFTRAGIWFTALIIPLFGSQLSSWAWVSVIVPLLWPATRKELTQATKMVLRSGSRAQ